MKKTRIAKPPTKIFSVRFNAREREQAQKQANKTTNGNVSELIRLLLFKPKSLEHLD